jgi:hypothetical protein
VAHIVPLETDEEGQADLRLLGDVGERNLFAFPLRAEPFTERRHRARA